MNQNSKLILTSGIILIIVIVFAGYVFLTNGNNSNLYGNEIRVLDGDTFEYNGEVIRLLCVDTPEKNDKGYSEAGAFLNDLLNNGDLIIEESGRDKYNRTLAYVYTNDSNEIIFVNREIVNEGYGKIYEYNGTDCSLLK